MNFMNIIINCITGANTGKKWTSSNFPVSKFYQIFPRFFTNKIFQMRYCIKNSQKQNFRWRRKIWFVMVKTKFRDYSQPCCVIHCSDEYKLNPQEVRLKILNNGWALNTTSTFILHPTNASRCMEMREMT